MFFGLTIEKLLLIGVLAALIVGPERLPRYAEGLARLVKTGREYLRGARSRVKDEMGPEFDEVDWRKLDPRQYDPRRIIREALLDDSPVKPVSYTPQAAVIAPSSAPGAAVRADAGEGGALGDAAPKAPPGRRDPGASTDTGVPFDSEAT